MPGNVGNLGSEWTNLVKQRQRMTYVCNRESSSATAKGVTSWTETCGFRSVRNPTSSNSSAMSSKCSAIRAILKLRPTALNSANCSPPKTSCMLDDLGERTLAEAFNVLGFVAAPSPSLLNLK